MAIRTDQKFATGTWQSLAYRRYASLDSVVLSFLQRHAVTALRLSMGIVYVWFGMLKFWPGVSPAEPLVRATMERFVPMNLFLPFLALWEVAIGVGFLWGRFPRVTIALMLLQMVGAMSPLVLLPGRMFAQFPVVFTLEGQYVFKDIILISAALVIGAATMSKIANDRKRKSGDWKRVELN